MNRIDEDMINKLHQNRAGLISLGWDDIYDSEQELIDDMMSLDANSKGKPMRMLVRGYDFINGFQSRIEKGMDLTDKQMIQLKRLASNIAYAKYIQKVVR